MSQRRMFSQDIVDSDSFLDMPVSSQGLYFHLAMRADDDGFVNPKKIMRLIGVSNDDLRVLLSKRFLLSFENGVVVIKHWLIHNMIRKDRYKETMYLEQKKLLSIKENGSYTEMSTNGLPNGNQMATQVRLGKDSIGKRESSMDYLKEIPTYDLEEFYSKYDTSRGKIKEKAESLYLYCQANGKKYKNYKAFLENALRKDFPAKKLIIIEEVKKEELGDRSEALNAHKPDFLKRK